MIFYTVHLKRLGHFSVGLKFKVFDNYQIFAKTVPSWFETYKIVFKYFVVHPLFFYCSCEQLNTIYQVYSLAYGFGTYLLNLVHTTYHIMFWFIFFFRIWSHGLQSHQRKSALWHYLYKFGRTNEKLLRFKGTLGVQAYCIPLINSKPYILPDHSRPIQVVIDPKVRKNSFVRAH